MFYVQYNDILKLEDETEAEIALNYFNGGNIVRLRCQLLSRIPTNTQTHLFI